MVKWDNFFPRDFEYDWQKDKLAVHRITLKEAGECFFSDYQVRRNKSYLKNVELNAPIEFHQKEIPTEINGR